MTDVANKIRKITIVRVHIQCGPVFTLHACNVHGDELSCNTHTGACRIAFGGSHPSDFQDPFGHNLTLLDRTSSDLPKLALRFHDYVA